MNMGIIKSLFKICVNLVIDFESDPIPTVILLGYGLT